MKVYISGAITGTHGYMNRFANAEDELMKWGDTVINPARVNAKLPKNTSYEEYMKMSLCMLDMCDAIYMLNGWEKSCGANREYGYAVAKHMIVIHEGERDKYGFL